MPNTNTPTATKLISDILMSMFLKKLGGNIGFLTVCCDSKKSISSTGVRMIKQMFCADVQPHISGVENNNTNNVINHNNKQVPLMSQGVFAVGHLICL